MGYDINAGKQKARIGYCGYLLLLQKMAVHVVPTCADLFEQTLRDSLSRQAQLDKLCNMLPLEIVRLICISDWDTISYDYASKAADILDKLDNLNEREREVRDVFRHARRYRASVHIS